MWVVSGVVESLISCAVCPGDNTCHAVAIEGDKAEVESCPGALANMRGANDSAEAAD